jgi:RHS repeat-associated protein
VYTPDQFGGGYNDGEFTVSGTSFTPNKLVVARKYYDAGGARVAMRENGTLYWLLTDYLGSTSKVANSDGSFHSEQMYKPFGEKRYPTGASTLPTTYRYTGQRSETGLGPAGGEGLMFYGARWYDALLGRWIQPDTVIPDPGNPLIYDRYAGVYNNALRYVDPSGHATCDADGYCGDDPSLTVGIEVVNDEYYDEFGDVPDIGQGKKDATIRRYMMFRRWLMNHYVMEYVNPITGKIDDDVILAIIIAGEFGALPHSSAVFEEALESLSNEYHEISPRAPCGGDCTLIEQLIWLQIIPSFRDDDLYEANVINAGWMNYQGQAGNAMGGYCYTANGTGCNSWVWGNVDSNSMMKYWIDNGMGRGTKYVEAWGDFVVLTVDQNTAMRVNGWQSGTGGQYWGK